MTIKVFIPPNKNKQRPSSVRCILKKKKKRIIWGVFLVFRTSFLLECTQVMWVCMYEANMGSCSPATHKAALTGLAFSKASRDGVCPLKRVNPRPPNIYTAVTRRDTHFLLSILYLCAFFPPVSIAKLSSSSST